MTAFHASATRPKDPHPATPPNVILVSSKIWLLKEVCYYLEVVPGCAEVVFIDLRVY